MLAWIPAAPLVNGKSWEAAGGSLCAWLPAAHEEDAERILGSWKVCVCVVERDSAFQVENKYLKNITL